MERDFYHFTVMNGTAGTVRPPYRSDHVEFGAIELHEISTPMPDQLPAHKPIAAIQFSRRVFTP